jgi:trk system potassium uptake protein TrkA
MYVIIVGASKIGVTLANLLISDKHNVVIVEKDEDKAKKLAEVIDALVVAGSGTEYDVLREAGADKADVIVAATSHDEVNLMVCELARMFNIRRMITLSVNPKHENIFKEIGVENIIYPSTTIAAHIRNLIVRPGISTVLAIMEDIEIIEVDIPKNSPLNGKVIKDIPLPENSSIAAIYRNGQLIIPRGSTIIKGGDKITALAKVQVIDKLTKVLRGHIY